METLRRNLRNFDFTTVVVLICLAGYSTLAIYAATYGKIGPHSDIPSHIVTKQIIWEVLGFIALGVTASVDYRTLRRHHWWWYIATTVLLVVVFKMPAVNYAHSWINVHGFTFQPSEFAKVSLIISIAAYMARVDESENPRYGFRNIGVIFLYFVGPFALTLKEPALGQSLVMFAIVMTMYAIFAKRTHFVILSLFLFALVIFVSAVATQYPDQATAFITRLEQVKVFHHHIIQQFQAGRIITWLNPNYDLAHQGYNVHQAQLAVGSGQLFGEGLLNGILTGGGGVPNQWTDYIFSAIGEEFGFVASSILIILFLTLVYRLVRIARGAQDTFGMYLIMGMVGMFGFQVFENIGMDMYMSPSTGITLPFISYGGTSLIANYIAVGAALSVGMRKKNFRFK